MSLGIIIVFITASGYVSNSLNWRYLNYGITRFLYYVGAFVHEASHAVLCVVTGAKIEEVRIFSGQPRVVYQRAKLPLVGGLLISAAPIAGGLLFLFLVDRYLLGNYFTLPQFSGWQDVFINALRFIQELDLLKWQSWVMVFLFLNAGAMLGPSTRDLKNVWPLLIILFFVKSSFFASLGLAALSLILINIFLQIVFISVLKTTRVIMGG